MLLNLGQSEKHTVQKLVSTGTFVQNVIDEYVSSAEDKPFDGYIHPSYLDWSKKPEAQVKKLMNKGHRAAVEAYRAYAQGNMIHELIETAFDGRVEGYSEIGYKSESILFAGTADYVAKIHSLGGVLFEFKSYSELQTDNVTGRTLFAKLEQAAGSMLRNTDNPITKEAIANGLINKYHLITDTQLKEIEKRLCTKEREHPKPDAAHLTQACTYAWIFNKIGYGVQRQKVDGEEVLTRRELPEIRWICVCYIGKGKWTTREFWIPVYRKPELLEKAKRNYGNVLKVFRSALSETQ